MNGVIPSSRSAALGKLLLAEGCNHRFLVLMITKIMWLFSTNHIQVFKYSLGFKKIQNVSSSKGRY